MNKLSPAAKEKDIQRACLDWLAAKRYFFYRQNTGAVKTPEGRFFRFGANGSPDIVVVRKGQYVGIEVKGPKGKQSEAQVAFQKDLEAAGGKYLLVHSIEELIQTLDRNLA